MISENTNNNDCQRQILLLDTNLEDLQLVL